MSFLGKFFWTEKEDNQKVVEIGFTCVGRAYGFSYLPLHVTALTFFHHLYGWLTWLAFGVSFG